MAAPVEEKPEVPAVEEHPALQEAHEDELGVKESALKVKEAELIAKEAAIKAKEDAALKVEASKKFAAVLQARSARCKKIVADLVSKDAIKMDQATYDSERQIGTYLLDAQHKAFQQAISAKQKELLAMNDESLLAMEKVVADLKAPVTKKASHIFVSPSYGEELSEDQEIAKIFKTMGTGKHPQ
jgi:DNA-binding MarR family transcriptional regulator